MYTEREGPTPEELGQTPEVRNPVLERYGREISGLLIRARERLDYLNNFNLSDKAARIQAAGRLADESEVASYQNIKRGSAVLTRMIEDLELAQSAVSEGRSNVNPLKHVEDVIRSARETWKREFEPPDSR
ncbi:MAG: hypothetical protein HYV13_02610 [Candidatus Doudnabacteria bacterium]|nr:hypothetical protein [Candidatus Doudnabacteria bacterium]